MQATSTAPRVLVVLVAHDGAEWLPRTLAALRAQTHADLDVLAIDNASTDGSLQVLLDHLDESQVLVADRDLGFGAAVAMALDARRIDPAPYLLLLHDDLALAPDAVAELVAAMETDPRLAVVGPKLRSWDRPDELQAVGWTIDLTGRADNGVDEGELDQGQRDQERRSLYVSSGGMLARREVFDELGGFDRRYHLFRDDLDLCWRAWLSGHEVEVVPAAVGAHVAGATNYLRLGQTRFIGPRYFAERNTLATLLKNYGALRLLLVVPLYVLVGLAKVAGFLLTRRVSDAWQTVRAWIWNVLHLRETLRARRTVQRRRRRTDRELRELFGRIAPRVRAYGEAMGEWVAGGDAAPEPVPAGPQLAPEERPAWRRVLGGVRQRPVLVTGLLLAVLVLASAWPLLVPGELRGGQLAPWPASPAAFLDDYASGWHEAGAFGTADAPSPAQAILGLLQLLLGGSAYLASRVLLLGSLGLGWLLALRATQVHSSRRIARVAAATAYVLSPPALAALATGEVGALVVLATLPGIAAAVATLARPTTAADRAWRAVAAATLLGAVAAAFEPLLLVLLTVVVALVALVGSLAARVPAWRRALAARSAVVLFGPWVLLLPWSLDLLGEGSPLLETTGATVGGELWRWLLLSPDLAGFPGLLAGAGFLLAGLLGLVLGTPRTPWLVAGLWTAALLGAVGGWWLDRIGHATWAGLPLLLTAAAFAGLFALAFATAEAQLTRHAFGWRQVAAVATAGAVTVSLGAVAVDLARGPWDAYVVEQPSLPAFVTNADLEDGPFRVLVLADEGDGVGYEVVEGSGPTMAAHGVPRSTSADAVVDAVVDDVLAGSDPRAADRLGLLDVRFVVVPAGGTSPALDDALRTQAGLEARPVASGRVLAVSGWLPRAAIVPPADAERIVATGTVDEDTEARPLEPRGGGVWTGETGASPGALLLAEPSDPDWRVAADGRPLTVTGSDLVRVDELPAGASVRVSHEGDTARTLAVAGQLLAVLLAISLALRPPRFARSFDRDATAHPGEGVPAPKRESEVVA